MKRRIRNRFRVSQKIKWRRAIAVLSVAAFLAMGTVALIQLYQTDKAVASTSVSNFNAYREKKSIVVRWMTYSEINSGYFVIERSGNGTDFVPITQINGAGNSNALRKYEFRDQDPLPNNNYYRLHQVDLNGISKFSNIISPIVNDNKVKEVKITRVYPNPFNDSLTVEFTAPSDQQYTIMLLSSEGKIVHEQPVAGFKGYNSIIVKPDVVLGKGTYFIPIVSGNEVLTATRANHM